MSDNRSVDKQEWLDWQFRIRHRLPIARMIADHATGTQLRQIAQMIGYVEAERG